MRERLVAVTNEIRLQQGEELMDFVNRVGEALEAARIDEDHPLFLEAIYDDHVVSRDVETGQFFRHDFARADDGRVLLGEPVEAMPRFVPTSQLEKSAGGAVDYVRANKQNLWAGVLGLSR